MNHIPWLLLLLGLPGTIVAQQKNPVEKQQIVNAVGQESTLGTVQTFNERYEGIKGSPFLTDEWTDGQVHMHNGQVFDQLQVKYNLYRDEIIVKRRDGAEVIPDKKTIRSFSLDTGSPGPLRRFVRVDYLPDNRAFPHNHFAEILYEGASTLLAVHDKSFIRADYRQAYHANRPYDKFGDVMTQYFWIAPDGRVHVLKPSKRAITKLFSDQKDVMVAFAEENQLDLRRPSDVVRLVQYYDQR